MMTTVLEYSAHIDKIDKLKLTFISTHYRMHHPKIDTRCPDVILHMLHKAV